MRRRKSERKAKPVFYCIDITGVSVAQLHVFLRVAGVRGPDSRVFTVLQGICGPDARVVTVFQEHEACDDGKASAKPTPYSTL